MLHACWVKTNILWTLHVYVHEQEVICKRAQERSRTTGIEASINLAYSMEVVILFSSIKCFRALMCSMKREDVLDVILICHILLYLSCACLRNVICYNLVTS